MLGQMASGFAARASGDLDLAEAELRQMLVESDVDPDELASGTGSASTGRPEDGPATENAPHVVSIAIELGFVAEQRGDTDRALALHRWVLDTALAQGYPRDAVGALEGLAATLSARGDAIAAARLLGAAGAARARGEFAPTPAEQTDIDRAQGRVEAALGPDETERLVDEGRALNGEAVLAALP